MEAISKEQIDKISSLLLELGNHYNNDFSVQINLAVWGKKELEEDEYNAEHDWELVYYKDETEVEYEIRVYAGNYSYFDKPCKSIKEAIEILEAEVRKKNIRSCPEKMQKAKNMMDTQNAVFDKNRPVPE
jgi:hypothetical protein